MTTGLDVFDKSVQQANNWLKDLMYELGWEDRHKAYLAMRVCLQTLRDRLTVQEAVHLGAQLPLIIRGFYYEGWNPKETPEKIRSKQEFLSKIKSTFNDPGDDPETIARGVFKILYHHVSQGEIQDVRQVLPDELKDLFPRRM